MGLHHHCMACPQFAVRETAPIWKKMRMYRIINRGQPKRCGPPAWVVGEVLTTPRRKKYISLFIVFELFYVSFLFLCCLIPIFLQVYRTLPLGGNPVAVNKYHVTMSCHFMKRIHVFRTWTDSLSFGMGGHGLV
jgi:hypothetical protein